MCALRSSRRYLDNLQGEVRGFVRPNALSKKKPLFGLKSNAKHRQHRDKPNSRTVLRMFANSLETVGSH